jgi:hypothetical protein
MRWIVLLLLVACTACGFGQDAPPPPSRTTTMAATPNVCRVGPNDGPILAERGIGGTGMPPFSAAVPAPAAPALPAGQRGIGGTGAQPLGTGTKAATGNTGIVGEITGFASVCLNGVEVAYDPATVINIDGQAEPPAALRAGQIAAVTAGPDTAERDGLLAAVVSIRHEVAGPVSAVDANTLTVAGQTVTWRADTRGMRHIMLGDWIAVSGFRNHAGVIVATRIDPQAPGAVTVHGTIVKKSGGYWIGELQLHMPLVSRSLRKGEAVTVTGVLFGTALDVASISPDLLYSNPQAYFGPSVHKLLIQSYVYTVGGPVYIAVGTSIYLAEGKLFYNSSGPSLFSLIVSPRGTLVEVGQLLGAVGNEINPFRSGPAQNGEDTPPPR